MSATVACGVVSVSIDAEDYASRPTVTTEAVDSALVELLDRFQKHRVPATWAVADPWHSGLAKRIASGSGHQELALFGGQALAHGGISQGEANHGLIARLLECRRAKLGITTVTADSTWQPQDIDLLAKHGITMIRGAGPIGGKHHGLSRRSGRGVQAVRYGVWYVPVSATLHGGWTPYFAQLQLLKRMIEQATAGGGICHLRIDAASIARGDVASGLRAVEQLLRHLDHLRTARSVAIETLHDTAIRLQPKRTVAAAKSILRAA